VPVLYELILLGALAILALAILVSLVRRSRRNRARIASAPVMRETRAAPRPVAAPPVAQPTMPAPAVPPEIAAVSAPAAPAAAAEVRSNEPVQITSRSSQTVSFSRNARPTTPGALPSAGAAVDLPARMPEDFAERDRLLKRMADARPDKANPFTARKSRIRRARLILQSLGRKFDHADPRIDLSQYPNNWPELARRKYSQAA
jgi:hypothetical protein